MLLTPLSILACFSTSLLAMPVVLKDRQDITTLQTTIGFSLQPFVTISSLPTETTTISLPTPTDSSEPTELPDPNLIPGTPFNFEPLGDAGILKATKEPNSQAKIKSRHSHHQGGGIGGGSNLCSFDNLSCTHFLVDDPNGSTSGEGRTPTAAKPSAPEGKSTPQVKTVES